MKTVFVAMRAIEIKGGIRVSTPIGVFTDKADALRAADECPRAMAQVNGTPVGNALAYVGIEGVGGGVLELPFVAGSGIQLVDKVLTDPNGRPIISG